MISKNDGSRNGFQAANSFMVIQGGLRAEDVPALKYVWHRCVLRELTILRGIHDYFWCLTDSSARPYCRFGLPDWFNWLVFNLDGFLSSRP